MSVTIVMLVIIIMVEVKMMMIAGVAAEKGDADGDNDKLFTDAILHKLMADAAQTSWGDIQWNQKVIFRPFGGGPEPTLQSISCMLKMGNTFQRRFRWQNVWFCVKYLLVCAWLSDIHAVKNKKSKIKNGVFLH